MINYRDLIGIPFKFDTDEINGVDCYNLLRRAFLKFNKIVPKTNISICACKQATNEEIEDHIFKYWEKIDEPEIPCAVLIKSNNHNFADHIATYIGDNKILHISVNTNSIIDRLYPRYKGRVLGFYRFIGDKYAS